ncbi:HAD family phosphatase, partial [Mobiluncus curtisii]|nr:HAD family phosphatase [Mobiluncus curtisii]
HTVGIADDASLGESDVLAREAEAYWEEFPAAIPDFMLQ